MSRRPSPYPPFKMNSLVVAKFLIKVLVLCWKMDLTWLLTNLVVDLRYDRV